MFVHIELPLLDPLQEVVEGCVLHHLLVAIGAVELDDTVFPQSIKAQTVALVNGEYL